MSLLLPFFLRDATYEFVDEASEVSVEDDEVEDSLELVELPIPYAFYSPSCNRTFTK